MDSNIANLSNAGRRAMAAGDWATVRDCANGILRRAPQEAEGFFLLGVFEKASQNPREAARAFERVLEVDPQRYDAAIELSTQYSMARRNREVAELLGRHEAALANSPRYLNLAGTVYTQIGMADKAWPLFNKAIELQPDISQFQANLATCAVYVGEIDTAKRMYRALLEKNPNHQHNHYQLSRLERATDHEHIEQMERVLAETGLAPDKNIFLYYALGKEYEDLQDWDRSFEYYKRAGDAVKSVANYDIGADLAIIDTIIETCNEEWLLDGAAPPETDKTPMFVVGLPRTGTTLTERIIASHSTVASVGETEFVQMVIRRESGVASVEKMTPDMIRAFAGKDISLLTNGYLGAVDYRLGDEPIFIDKLPFNVLYLGFIAKAWPNAPMVLLRRNPMDSCFSMYKQAFTWAYKFSYDLQDLGAYYVAYDRLCRHWKNLIGDRLVEVGYEALVSDQETQTRSLLDRLGLEFEEACLSFEKNAAPSSTASSVQVRQKAHTGSVNKWKRYEQQLQPLREILEQAGIAIE